MNRCLDFAAAYPEPPTFSVSRVLTLTAIVALSIVGSMALLLAVVASEHPGTSALGVVAGITLGVGFVVWAHWLGRQRAAERREAAASKAPNGD